MLTLLDVEKGSIPNKTLSAIEIEYIALFESRNPQLGYNLSRGGEGKSYPSSRKGKPLSEEHKRRIGLGNKGKVRSEAERANLSALYKGKKGRAHTAEAKQRMSEATKGKPKSLAHRLALSKPKRKKETA